MSVGMHACDSASEGESESVRERREGERERESLPCCGFCLLLFLFAFLPFRVTEYHRRITEALIPRPVQVLLLMCSFRPLLSVGCSCTYGYKCMFACVAAQELVLPDNAVRYTYMQIHRHRSFRSQEEEYVAHRYTERTLRQT